jgi:hypothetical protein
MGGRGGDGRAGAGCVTGGVCVACRAEMFSVGTALCAAAVVDVAIASATIWNDHALGGASLVNVILRRRLRPRRPGKKRIEQATRTLPSDQVRSRIDLIPTGEATWPIPLSTFSAVQPAGSKMRSVSCCFVLM